MCRINFVCFIQDFIDVINKIEHTKIEFPKSKKSLIFWYLFYESITRNFSLDISKKQKVVLSANTKYNLGRCFSKYKAYLILLAHDEWVEKYNPTIDKVYEQLSRCLIALLVGLKYTFPVSKNTLTTDFDNINKITKHIFETVEFSQYEILPFFLHKDFIQKITDKKSVFLEDILYRTNNKKYDDSLNVTILASLSIGITLKSLNNILFLEEIYSQEELDKHQKTILGFFIKAAHGQANSINQKNISKLTLKSYIPIACEKTNSLVDAMTYVKFILNPSIFYQKRFNSNRFCEQFYLDDLQDISEDSLDGILGILHLFLIEQGVVAKELIPYIQEYDFTSTQIISIVKKISTNTPLLQTHYNGIFLYKNYLFQSKRNDEGKLIFTHDNIENILKEMLVNSRSELSMSLKDIILKRFLIYKVFQQNWNNKNYRDCYRIIYASELPDKFVNGFLKFLRENKNLSSNFQLSEYIYYLYLFLTSYKNKVNFWLHKKFGLWTK